MQKINGEGIYMSMKNKYELKKNIKDDMITIEKYKQIYYNITYWFTSTPKKYFELDIFINHHILMQNSKRDNNITFDLDPQKLPLNNKGFSRFIKKWIMIS